MGELVDQHELRPALENCVEVHLGESVALVLHPPPRDRLEALEKRLGLESPVRLDHPDDDFDALAPLRLRRQQHLVGLADAGGGAEKDLEPAAPLLVGRDEERFGRWPRLAFRHPLSLAQCRRLP